MKRKLILPTVAAILVILIFGAAVFGGTVAWLSKNRQAQSNMNMKLQATALQLEGLHIYKRGADGHFHLVDLKSPNDSYEMDDYDTWNADGKYKLYIAAKLDKIPENVTSLNVSFKRDPSLRETSTLVSISHLSGLADSVLSFSDESKAELNARDAYLTNLQFQGAANFDSGKDTITFTNINGDDPLVANAVFLFCLDYDTNLSSFSQTELDKIDMFAIDDNIDSDNMTYRAPYLNDFTNIIFEIPEN